MADASTNKKNSEKPIKPVFVKSINFLIDNQPQRYLRKKSKVGF